MFDTYFLGPINRHEKCQFKVCLHVIRYIFSQYNILAPFVLVVDYDYLGTSVMYILKKFEMGFYPKT